MSTNHPLCIFPPALPPGCCSPQPQPPAAPISLYNPPGLSSIHYRIGTFASFRRAMLDAVTRPNLMGSATTGLSANVGSSDPTITVENFIQFPSVAPFTIQIGNEFLNVTGGAGTANWTVARGANDSTPARHRTGDLVVLDLPSTRNPFAGWREATDGDYLTMFVELWAYLADILTFYQERIANEAFISTATQRDSLLRLTRLIDYHPGPGSAASSLVAFTVAKGKAVTVPANFRVSSRALPGKPAVVFETTTAITALGENSAIPMSAVSPAVQFAPHTIVLEGVNNRLASGDYILAVENEATVVEAPYLLQVTAVSFDKKANTTTVVWRHPAGAYFQASKQVRVYALRVNAGPFGNTAPPWDNLPSALTNSDGQHPSAPYQVSWDVSNFFFTFQVTESALRAVLPLQKISEKFQEGLGSRRNDWFFLPVQGDSPDTLFLDGVYADAKGTPANPGWAVLLADGHTQVLHVIDARQASKTAYATTSKVTRLAFRESVQKLIFPLRTTVILTGSERLTLKEDLPLPQPLSGGTLILAGVHTNLQKGQAVIVRGNLYDPIANAPTDVSFAESGILDAPPAADPQNDITTVILHEPLANLYDRVNTVLVANVAQATQGETVKDEVLGSSDGSAFQSYPLKQKPLTYLPSTDPATAAAVESTLLVTVNGVRWNERPTLVESDPQAPDFTTALEESGQTTVIFGDGLSGARPPSGKDNIHARYRKGLGASGNLVPDSIQQLIDSIPGLQKVTNPVSSSGGGDPESLARIRVNAPGSLRTFGRAVSTTDYAALALSYPGIAKASASWVLREPATLQAVPQPYIQLTAATVDRAPFQHTVFAGQLRRFLDSHRDPNVPLRILDFTPVYIDVAVQVNIDDRFPQQGTLAQVRRALNPGLNPDGSAGYFAFDRLEFGQSIHLSAVYAAVQGVPGVKDATVLTLRRMDLDAGNQGIVRNDIFIRPTEIATIQNDPSDPAKGMLTLTLGQGGFRDT